MVDFIGVDVEKTGEFPKRIFIREVHSAAKVTQKRNVWEHRADIVVESADSQRQSASLRCAGCVNTIEVDARQIHNRINGHYRVGHQAAVVVGFAALDPVGRETAGVVGGRIGIGSD